MYIFGAESLATLELEGMILSLIRAKAIVKDPVRMRTERVRRAAFYEEYAQRVLRGAFPEIVPAPEVLAARGITKKNVTDAVNAVWGFRSGSNLLSSELSLECRWMLEGYAGIITTANLQPWEWRKELRESSVLGLK